jgi:hypothetical protein
VTIPSIKGTAFLSAHADVNALVARRAIGRDELELALKAEDLRLLDEKVMPTAWYPIASYARLLELLCDKEGHGNVEGYLVMRGEKAGERIAATGIYQQLDASAEALGMRAGRIVVTVAGLIYNFTSWHSSARARRRQLLDPRGRGDEFSGGRAAHDPGLHPVRLDPHRGPRAGRAQRAPHALPHPVSRHRLVLVRGLARVRGSRRQSGPRARAQEPP